MKRGRKAALQRLSGMGSVGPMNAWNACSLRSPTNLAAIFCEHFDYVWATLRRLGVREADREDLVHDVFMKVHARLADFDEGRSMRAWLFGFAYRVTADYQRLARHRVEVLGALDDAASDRPSAEERIASIELRDVILEALQTLDLDRRALLVMHHIHEIPVPQLAQTLEIPLNTAYSRLRLARDQLARAVTDLRIARGVR